ncbi:LysR family transcriptional regulator [Bifidobacterium miconisargentati]|uniref:LysR family transcriptional regulator n=1 Tax=Bifidobacterium miconisargentati TaxID=2834437 RepID=UPI001BDD7C68|nr:LysR family transcriptional regulator [Bifidobacterium miconisargentati]MBW3090019.1 LysR family transcriptional regulator [Bifidobacterium miconisargentati]
METEVLRHFTIVVQEGGIASAAEMLKISQSTLSRQIQSLEQEVGTTLLQRRNRGRELRLTREDQLLYRRAEEIVSLTDRACAEIASGAITGDVHIAAAQLPSVYIIAQAANDTRSEHPDVRFHLTDGYSTDIMRQLDRGLVDFGVLVQPVDMGDYDYIDLPDTDRNGLLMPESHPLADKEHITKADLRTVKLLVPQGALSRNNLSGWLNARDRRNNVVGTMNLAYNASLFVKAGYGCAVIPEGIIDTSPGSGLKLVPLDPPLMVRSCLAWKRHQPLTEASEAFLRYVKARIEARKIDT